MLGTACNQLETPAVHLSRSQRLLLILDRHPGGQICLRRHLCPRARRISPEVESDDQPEGEHSKERTYSARPRDRGGKAEDEEKCHGCKEEGEAAAVAGGNRGADLAGWSQWSLSGRSGRL